MTQIIPYDDRVVIKKIEDPERTKSGVIIPSIDKEGATAFGEIIAVGPGRFDVNGNRMKMFSEIGDKVVYSQFGVHIVHIEDDEYLVAKEFDLIAKMQDNIND